MPYTLLYVGQAMPAHIGTVLGPPVAPIQCLSACGHWSRPEAWPRCPRHPALLYVGQAMPAHIGTVLGPPVAPIQCLSACGHWSRPEAWPRCPRHPALLYVGQAMPAPHRHCIRATGGPNTVPQCLWALVQAGGLAQVPKAPSTAVCGSGYACPT